MTLISALIRDAMRESNLIAASADPSTAEVTEGVSVLNQFIGSLYGHEAGQEFVDATVSTTTHTARPNERDIITSNAGAVTITLADTPDNGARFQVIDTVIGASRAIDVSANGRLIEGAATVSVAAGTNRIWMYRGDLGEWVRIAPLAAGDLLPFPTDYEPLFIAALAIRLNDRNGQPVSDQLKEIYARDIERIKFDYRQLGQADEPRTRALLNRALTLAGHIAANGQPRAPQLTDALRRLNATINSLFGEELGERLTDQPFTDALADGLSYIPLNLRLVGDLSRAQTVKLHPYPSNGSRFAVIGDFAGTALTIDGNGRDIEGGTNVTLSSDDIIREWFFRADLGQWVRLTPITLTDEPPFPEEYDQLLEIMTAIRLSPDAITDTTLAASRRMLGQFKARYRQSIEMGSELGLLQGYATRQGYFDADSTASDMFTQGLPFRRF